MALGKTISQINKLTSREIVEWEAYDTLYGLPWKRLEKITANGIAFQGNTNPYVDHAEPLTAEDFLPGLHKREEENEEETPEFDAVSFGEAFKAYAIAMGAVHA